MTDPGGNNSLSALNVTPGELVPAFSQNTLVYTVNVESTVTSVNVSATTAHPQAAMSGDVSSSPGLGSGQRTIQLQPPGVTTPVTIWVTAPGSVQKTYTVNVTRAALGMNNNLAGLTVSPGSLTPPFNAASTSYAVSVGIGVGTINVTPTLQDRHASAIVNGRNTSSGQIRSISLNAPESSTKITITVVPSSGAEKTYLITVNRGELLGAPLSPKEAFTSPEHREITKSSRTMSSIMISYRRDDSADVTGRIYDRLIHQFGQEAVFKDVDSIPLSVDFRKYLDEQVSKCDVFLVVIGRDWMRVRGSKGKSRLEDPEDFVRIEIESALRRCIPVIPVLVSGAKPPSADRLPASIQDLPYRNGISIRPDPDFHRDMDRLIGFLKQSLNVNS